MKTHPIQSGEDYIEEVRADLRRLRRAKGLSQQDIADMLGYVGNSNISDFERGKTVPGTAHFAKIVTLVEEWRKEELATAVRIAVSGPHVAREDGPNAGQAPAPANPPQAAATPDLLDALARAYDANRPDLAAKLRASVADLDALDKKRTAVLEQQAEILAAIAAEGGKGT